MSSQDAIAFWLTEEKPDKTRRRRSCLGCGDAQEYLIRSNRNDTKEPAPSYVAWFKAHQGCRPDKSFDAEMPQEPGVAEELDSPEEPAATSPLYSVGMRIEACNTACSGWTTGQVVKVRGNGSLGNVQVHLDGYKKPCYPFDIRPVLMQSSEENPLPECPQCGFVGVYLKPNGLCDDCEASMADRLEDDPRITAFMERMKISRSEFFAMVGSGQIKMGQFASTEASQEGEEKE